MVKAASKLVQLGVGIAKFKVISGCHFGLVFIGFIFFFHHVTKKTDFASSIQYVQLGLSVANLKLFLDHLFLYD